MGSKRDPPPVGVARATEQRRIDAIFRAVAEFVGEDEARRTVAEVEAHREQEEDEGLDPEFGRRIREEASSGTTLGGTMTKAPPETDK